MSKRTGHDTRIVWEREVERRSMFAMTPTAFQSRLGEFGMGELKFMFDLCGKKDLRLYYGPELIKQYRSALLKRITSRKEREIEYEVWR